MPKLTKTQTKLHARAEALLAHDDLTPDDVEFCFKHWRPDAAHNVGVSGTFFTPYRLAEQAAIFSLSSGRLVDMCAGIGLLGHLAAYDAYEKSAIDLVCVELNPDFVRVGRKLVPHATWVQGSIFDEALWDDLGPFTAAICNPPFGNVKTAKGETDWIGYKGPADLMAVAVAAKVTAVGGTFILPSMSVPFQFSHNETRGYHEIDPERWPTKLRKLFDAVPGLEMNCVALDTSSYEKEWVVASPRVELVDVALHESTVSTADVVARPRPTPAPEREPSETTRVEERKPANEQLTLFP